MKILIERRNAGTTDWCPLMEGVHLREVFVTGGSTEANSCIRTPDNSIHV